MSVNAKPGQPLSKRELQVLDYVSRGFTDPQIAQLMHLSRHTVASRVRSILVRLEVSTRTEAACRAVREGLI